MNELSSRSHCIISLHVERTVRLPDEDTEGEEEDDDDDEDGFGSDDTGDSRGEGDAGSGRGRRARGMTKKILSVLHLVDLAGSERVAKTGATGVRMVEGGHINKSLTTLTNVINRLTEIHNSASQAAGGGAALSTFVPYRDSRLTHLLKTAIGGNSFTIIICCITPALESVNESRSTLQFASRAKCIKNKVTVNELADRKTQLRLLQLECHRLRRTMVAHTLYMWSKDVKIKKLKEALLVAGVGGGGRRHHDPAGRDPSSVTEQQQVIIEQLTAERDALQEQVQTLTQRVATGDAARPPQEVRELQVLLKESEAQRAQSQKALQELDGLCQEVEKENEANKRSVKQLTEKCRELEGLLEAVDEEGQATHQEMGLLRQQLQQTQQRLVQKGEGGDAYLAELTQLHVRHQELQYRYETAQKKEQAELSRLQRKVQSLGERLSDAEEERDEVADQNKLLHSYLWRLLSVAQMLTQRQGRAAAPAAVPAGLVNPSPADTAARGREVAAAVQALTQLAAQRGDGDGAGAGGHGGSREALLERLRSAEAALVQKDAQRDIIIDAKLKRIQGLVLRLHTMNQSLVGEMQAVFQDNDTLFQLASKHASVSAKISKLGLAPRSLELALERAKYARPPERPFGHN
ncbi:kinesin family member 3/17 [Strigomonas culicis]|uniref:Kinesin-like protein n=1 Tax=Strigomonas culicis TaxID=28005 RepID=S9UIM8_9TRYP|nr:kinesin family member 3/17 [Strigomonas culicis]|eukprot:EPY28574.1 kinesin family member 3/17 [Strigomonas culicis]